MPYVTTGSILRIRLRTTHLALEVANTAHTVVDELSLRFHHAVALRSVAVKPPGIHLPALQSAHQHQHRRQAITEPFSEYGPSAVSQAHPRFCGGSVPSINIVAQTANESAANEPYAENWPQPITPIQHQRTRQNTIW